MSECPHNSHGCSVEIKIDRIECKIDRFIERVSKLETSLSFIKNFALYVLIPILVFIVKENWK